VEQAVAAAEAVTQPLLERIAQAIATATATVGCPESGEVVIPDSSGRPTVGVIVVGPNTQTTQGEFSKARYPYFDEVKQYATPIPYRGWERGHLVGQRLGGSNNLTNLIPVGFIANRNMARREREARDAATGSCIVYVAAATYLRGEQYWSRVPNFVTISYINLPGWPARFDIKVVANP
jgi:hypothetical protein